MVRLRRQSRLDGHGDGRGRESCSTRWVPISSPARSWSRLRPIPGWTPLFLTAGGLVMEMGGSNSHGAVVAREYGIPAVVGVPEATHKIETGQLITVDGAAGLVSLAG